MTNDNKIGEIKKVIGVIKKQWQLKYLNMYKAPWCRCR